VEGVSDDQWHLLCVLQALIDSAATAASSNTAVDWLSSGSKMHSGRWDYVSASRRWSWLQTWKRTSWQEYLLGVWTVCTV